MGQASTKHEAAAARIENADRVIVDSSALHCPVCLCIFSRTPVILPCGHSFCKTCIRRLIENSLQFTSHNFRQIFECPLCREPCASDLALTKNFVVDALLESVDDIASLKDLPPADNNLRVSNQRLNQKLREVEEQQRILQKQLDEQKRTNRLLLTAAVLASGLFLAVLIKFMW
ncbi:unnamed protein product [Anisakis simplex]|uniref:RING-type domain-containing protein n=1 Tax=Anisakis simplex TaxID=6269 RepID=A0A0M3K6B2_ANISI|nr:unnamed protein product [Anisakis simplex]